MYCSSFKEALIVRGAFPSVQISFTSISFLLSALGGWIVWVIASRRELSAFPALSHRLFAKIPLTFSTFFIILVCLRGFVEFPLSNTIPYHPIDWLIRDAHTQHVGWLKQANYSIDLGQAVKVYRQRYYRSPPPGFDQWYRYATEASSLVVDDFDDMYRDLAPFWGISPHDIRLRTAETISDEWNEVAKIMIRGGKAEISPDVKPTHRWMMEGVQSMVQDFAQWLPDMDLAFNINDEPRVAIPYRDMHKLLKAGEPQSLDKKLTANWSANRASQWTALDTQMRPFTDFSFTRTFQSFGSIACPPSSAARRDRAWDASSFYPSYSSKHSLSGFLSNWTLSASPCHQPDLANLHGLYLSPAAFKPSTSLYPVFSQSKPSGFADILYPSPWNYQDKVKYETSAEHPDPPFSEKTHSLFWRGATSEGVSRFSSWKGMTRQRAVHLANNQTATDRITMLLPHPSKTASYIHTNIPSPMLSDIGLNITDIHIVESIARCWDNDCDDQDREFSPGSIKPSPFQSHWQYKYLLDLDGAGFSGRFLPFLRSRSLPFKAALFREWYEGRLTAWKHFVPLDIRFQGFYSTLAYFAGTKPVHGGNAGEGNAKISDSKGGKFWKGMMERQSEAETIAEEGREWAGKVLRKEDMRIWMFRLLLEWGRLTDDRRDELGFTP